MLTRGLGFSVVLFFLILSLFHLYWAAGGKFGSAVAVPSVAGRRSFRPSPAGTVVVAAACFVAALVVCGQIGLLGNGPPAWIFRRATQGISAVFFLRAIGDFKLVGFFKRVNETGFAYWDTYLFSPLCLLTAVATFIISFRRT